MHKFKISKFISIIKLNIYYFFPIDGITFDKNLNGKFRFFYDKRIDGSTIYSQSSRVKRTHQREKKNI